MHSGSCSSVVVHQVEESGTYSVLVFSIRQHRGIIDSFVSFFEEVVVNQSSGTIPEDKDLKAIGMPCT